MRPAYTPTGEQLLLLLLDDASGRLLAHAAALDVAIGAAHLLDLSRHGWVEVEEPTRRWGLFLGGDVRVAGVLPRQEALREAYQVVAEKEGSATAVIKRLGRGQRELLLGRLVERGVVERRSGRAGWVPVPEWPAVEVDEERRVSGALHAVLLLKMGADAHLAALVVLLRALGVVDLVVQRGAVPTATVSERSRAIADGDWEEGSMHGSRASTQAAMNAAARVVAAHARRRPS